MYCEVSLVISCFALSPHFHLVSWLLHHQITTMCILEFLFSSHLTHSFMQEVCFCSHQGFLISCKIFSSGSYHRYHILQDSTVHSCCNETPKSHILNLCSCSSRVIFCSLWCLTLYAFIGATCYWHLGINKWTTCHIWCSVSTLLTYAPLL